MGRERPNIPKDLIARFCRKHHIRKLSIFGSYLREDFGSKSDIDFLVEFDPAHIPGLIEFAGMEIELSDLLGGQKVDLRTPQELSRYFRDEVMAEAEVQYSEGPGQGLQEPLELPVSPRYTPSPTDEAPA